MSKSRNEYLNNMVLEVEILEKLTELVTEFMNKGDFPKKSLAAVMETFRTLSKESEGINNISRNIRRPVNIMLDSLEKKNETGINFSIKELAEIFGVKIGTMSQVETMNEICKVARKRIKADLNLQKESPRYED